MRLANHIFVVGDSSFGDPACELSRAGIVKLFYRLGCEQASGVLTIALGGASGREVFVLRRGAIMVGEGELARRMLVTRLARLVSLGRFAVSFHDGVNAYPPGPQHQVSIASWLRSHIEAELDGARADSLVRELAGMRLSIHPPLAPSPADEADRRMLAAMEKPRRLDQIWPLARTSRFRMLAFLHFLRSVDALVAEGVVAEQLHPPLRPVQPAREAAARLLGLEANADDEAIKRAYRQLARALHPDLQPRADADHRRNLELRFAEVTAAYEVLR
jgi:DnaJ-domain-containing protein 1